MRRRARATAALLILAAAAGPAAASTGRGIPFEQFLNVRSAGSGALAPDGSRVAFLTNISGLNQIWVVGAAGGWPDQITFFPDRVQWVRWSPSGDLLLFGKDAGGDERTQLHLAVPDGSRVEALTSKPKVIHQSALFSPDGGRIAYASNEREEAFFDIYVMDLATRASERVLSHDGNNAVAAWAPDGSGLVITRTRASLDADLHLLDLKSRRLTHLTPHEGAAVYRDVSWPPGDVIYVATDQGRDFVNLAAIDVRSPRATFLEDRTRDVESMVFSRDGRRVVVSGNERGASKLELREGGLMGRLLPSPELPGGVASGLGFTPDGRLLLIRLEGPAEPGDLWLHDMDGARTTRVTRSSLAGIPRSSFVHPETVSYRSFDGLEIPALLYLPADAAGARASSIPAIVMIHGGPEGQSRPGFSQINQYFVSRGYAVLAPNIRGSTGYGKRYHRLDDVRGREAAIRDVAAAADYLKATGRVDPSRLAVMGGSYGGYMTLAALTFHPELWAAGVDIVGISNLKSFLKNTGSWRVKMRTSEYGDPVADSEYLDRVSPLNHVDRIRAPLIVIQGANDPRVPRSEADQIVESLRRRGQPVEYLVFDDEGHGVVKLPNRIRAYTAVGDFLDRYLQPAASTAGSPGSKP